MGFFLALLPLLFASFVSAAGHQSHHTYVRSEAELQRFLNVHDEWDHDVHLVLYDSSRASLEFLVRKVRDAHFDHPTDAHAFVNVSATETYAHLSPHGVPQVVTISHAEKRLRRLQSASRKGDPPKFFLDPAVDVDAHATVAMLFVGSSFDREAVKARFAECSLQHEGSVQHTFGFVSDSRIAALRRRHAVHPHDHTLIRLDEYASEQEKMAEGKTHRETCRREFASVQEFHAAYDDCFTARNIAGEEEEEEGEDEERATYEGTDGTDEL